MDLIKEIHKRASVWTFFGFLIPALAVLVLMDLLFQAQILIITGGRPILDVRPWYSFEAAVQLFNLLGENGRALYSQQQILDAVFPILFGTAFSQGIAHVNNLRGEEDTAWRKLVLLPFLETFFDYLENLLIATQLMAFPALSPVVISFACIATIAKWVLLILAAFSFIASAAKSVSTNRRA